MELENLICFKYKLKLKEWELLNMESYFGKIVSCNFYEYLWDELIECKLREKFILLKLYFMYYFIVFVDYLKLKKVRIKMIKLIMFVLERCLNVIK